MSFVRVAALQHFPSLGLTWLERKQKLVSEDVAVHTERGCFKLCVRYWSGFACLDVESCCLDEGVG